MNEDKLLEVFTDWKIEIINTYHNMLCVRCRDSWSCEQLVELLRGKGFDARQHRYDPCRDTFTVLFEH